jgi:hypothetical protein
MRTILLFAWLTLPIAGAAYHYGPGQERLRLDDAAVLIATAETAVADEDWKAAIDGYDQALQQLPGDQAEAALRLRIERAKARMFANQLPVARREFEEIVRELETASATDGAADAGLLGEGREALANSQFYLTWLMRLEGKQRAEWEPQIEAARQNYRLLAEAADDRGDALASQRHKQDLETSVRLARIELEDLQGLPLPSQ